MGKVFSFFLGRSTFFALFFAVCGTTLAFKHSLTTEYVALITALQALIITHSYKEDKVTQGGTDAK